MAANGPVLLCYDGSADARAAIEAAAALFQGREAVVTCFWQPFAQLTNRFSVHLLELVQERTSVNEREAALAQELADEGAELAREAGMSAQSQAVEVSSPIDEAIIVTGEELDACAIVLGSRGRASIASFLLGDVANRVVQRANRPVLLVPGSPTKTPRPNEKPVDVDKSHSDTRT